MPSSNFNLKGIPHDLMNSLKHEAKKMHKSVNLLILQIIEKEIGISLKKNIYHDLDLLSDTWSREDAKNFYCKEGN